MNSKNYSELVRERRSVRTFDGKGLGSREKEQLQALAGNCGNPYGIPVEFRFLNTMADGVGSKVISGTDDFVAAKLRKVPHFEEALGFSMERFVLDAWDLGIGTTWIGGTMDRPAFERAMDLAEGEVMPCVTPIGCPAKRMSFMEFAMRKGVGADKRKTFEELFFDGDPEEPLTEEKAGRLLLPLEMVRLGPSAVNKQPWRLVLKDGLVHFYNSASKGFENSPAGDMQKIDMGIALCHFALGAEEAGVRTEFEIADPKIPMPDRTEYIASYRICG